MGNIPREPDDNQVGNPPPGGLLDAEKEYKAEKAPHVQPFRRRLVDPLPEPKPGDLASEEDHRLLREGLPSTWWGKLGYMKLSEVESLPQDWLWGLEGNTSKGGVIPLGELTLMAGEKGMGKTLFALWLSCRLSRGELRGIYHGQPQNVVFLTSEDSAKTLRRRAAIMGGDLDRIYILTPGQKFNLFSVLDLNPALIVLDPMSTFIQTPSQENAEINIRNQLVQFTALCQRQNRTVLGLRHFSKGSAEEGDNPFDKVLGSRAWVDAPRAVIFLTRDPQRPDDEQAGLVFSAGNLSKPNGPMPYHIGVQTESFADGRTDEVTTWVFDDELHSSVSLKDVFVKKHKGSSKLDEALAFLDAELSDGPVPSTKIKALATEWDISPSTLKRACLERGVQRLENGDWMYPGHGE